MSRIIYSIDDLLKNIEGSVDGCGDDLALSKFYDEIKESRFEEDERLSLGIWERELKKADWPKVEELCATFLINKSKDLQVIGWLFESLVMLDGFKGITNGIKILNEFIKTYWNVCFPKTDNEQKINILEWIYETINKRAISIPFIKKDDDSISIYNYNYALEIKSILIRSPEQTKEIQSSIEKNNIKTLDAIQNIIKSTDKKSIIDLQKDFEKIKIEKNNLEQSLQNIANGPTFSKLISNIDKLNNILSGYVESESQNKIASNEQEIQINMINEPKLESRDEIYEEIGKFAQKLRKIEKHSPSYYILDMVVSWKDKNLLEIITDLKAGTSEAHELLKILLNS